MLASCKKKERPVDNDRYVRTAPDNPKKVRLYCSKFITDLRFLYRQGSITMVSNAVVSSALTLTPYLLSPILLDDTYVPIFSFYQRSHLLIFRV